MYLLIQPQGGERIRVPLDRERIRIGRSGENEVPLTHDPALSRFHLELTRQGDAFFVRDIGSRHGTLLNGKPVMRSTELRPGDQITVGQTTMLFSTSDEQGLESTSEPLAANTVAIPLAEVMDSTLVLSQSATMPGVEEAVHPQARAFALVSSAAGRLLAQHPVEEILEIVLDMVAEVSSPDRSAVLLLEGDPPRLQLRNVRSVQADEEEDGVQISQTIARMVVQQKQAVLTTDAQLDDRLADSDSIFAQGVRSAMCVPLWNNKEVIGLIYADCVGDAGRFKKEDLEVLTLIGNLAAIKIENARLFLRDQQMREMERELAAAAHIQQRLQPTSAPEISGYELTGINIPCREVGGDCFDFRLRPDGKVGIAIGDVAGKGLGAALLVSTLQAEFRALLSTDIDVPSLVARLNQAVYENSDADMFATFVLCELDSDSGRLTYTNAGHNPPLLLRADGGTKKLVSGDLVLGFRPDISYSVKTVDIQPGEVLVLYSDGITESRDPAGVEFGEERLIQAVLARRDRPAEEIRRHVELELESFVGGQERFDDVTLTILKRKEA